MSLKKLDVDNKYIVKVGRTRYVHMKTKEFTAYAKALAREISKHELKKTEKDPIRVMLDAFDFNVEVKNLCSLIKSEKKRVSGLEVDILECKANLGVVRNRNEELKRELRKRQSIIENVKNEINLIKAKFEVAEGLSKCLDDMLKLCNLMKDSLEWY